MTPKTKLEILGPYTPEHPGPFCTRDGQPVRLITKTEGSDEYPIVGYIGNYPCPISWKKTGESASKAKHDPDSADLMNAREVPVAREFWAVEYMSGLIELYSSKDRAVSEKRAKSYVRTIHVREVLPGESA